MGQKELPLSCFLTVVVSGPQPWPFTQAAMLGSSLQLQLRTSFIVPLQWHQHQWGSVPSEVWILSLWGTASELLRGQRYPGSTLSQGQGSWFFVA